MEHRSFGYVKGIWLSLFACINVDNREKYIYISEQFCTWSTFLAYFLGNQQNKKNDIYKDNKKE